MTAEARGVVGDTPDKIDVYDLEQAAQRVVTDTLIRSVLDGDLHVEDLATDHFLRELHADLYGDIWQWAGRLRRREATIGIDPNLIAVELRAGLDTLVWRWTNTTDWTAHEFGIAVHAETVRIHPFVDGNGRTTRLLADLVFLAVQDDEYPPATYDWNVDKAEYVRLLQQFDRDRDPAALARFVRTVSVVD
ncbi:mobile mystery protein B [Tsukamurella soli]|uniref:Mobile mystery protein B n=1 Tax=Tsukamurella soli TaxID=644556 RepID=A0ABP8J4F0_9ACTN